MSEEPLPAPGTTVSVPVVSPLTIIQPGKVVAAPVAPETGHVTGPAVVVAVKEWFHSSTIWVALVGLLGSGLDAAITVLLPILQSPDPIDWSSLPSKLVRPFLVALALGYVGLRRKTDNSVVR